MSRADGSVPSRSGHLGYFSTRIHRPSRRPIYRTSMHPHPLDPQTELRRPQVAEPGRHPNKRVRRPGVRARLVPRSLGHSLKRPTLQRPPDSNRRRADQWGDRAQPSGRMVTPSTGPFRVDREHATRWTSTTSNRPTPTHTISTTTAAQTDPDPTFHTQYHPRTHIILPSHQTLIIHSISASRACLQLHPRPRQHDLHHRPNQPLTPTRDHIHISTGQATRPALIRLNRRPPPTRPRRSSRLHCRRCEQSRPSPQLYSPRLRRRPITSHQSRSGEYI